MASVHRRLFITLAALAALGVAACGKTGDAKPGDMTMGDPKAKVTMVEYASASCPHCARFNNEVFPEFKKKYVDTGKVHYVFREYLTAPAQVAAAGFLVARCAGNDKYFPVLDQIFHDQDEMFSSGDYRGVLLRIAKANGMSEDQFTACITNDGALSALQGRVQTAMEKDKIESTPTFVINGKKLEGEQTMATFDAVIGPMLK
jgi:protein-disulfide isomerase